MQRKLNDLISRFSDGEMGRREFLTRIAVIPGGIAAASVALPMLHAPAARAQPGGPPPYTMAERDRRWSRIRALLSEQGYDCLILPHRSGDGVNLLQYATYVSGGGYFPFGDGAVVFPVDGEPAVIGARFPTPWVSWRVQKAFDDGIQVPLGQQIVDVVNEMGHAGGNIAAVGTRASVGGLNEFINEGLVTYATWASVLAGLPDATITDITEQFGLLMMVKGAEEVANVTRAAEVGEDLHRMLLDVAGEGVDSLEIRSRIASFLVENDAQSDVQALLLPPGPLSDGQVINSEYGIIHSGGYAQVTLCLAVGSMSSEMEALTEVAHESMDYGAENLVAGARFGDVIDGMEEIVASAGYWHRVPQIHGLLPMTILGPVFDGPDMEGAATLGADVTVEEGMVFSFEPSARQGPSAEAKVGATAIVTADGLDVINQIGTRVQRV